MTAASWGRRVIKNTPSVTVSFSAGSSLRHSTASFTDGGKAMGKVWVWEEILAQTQARLLSGASHRQKSTAGCWPLPFFQPEKFSPV